MATLNHKSANTSQNSISYSARATMETAKQRREFFALMRNVGTLTQGNAALAARVIESVLYVWQRTSYPWLAAERSPYGCRNLLRSEPVRYFASWLASQAFDDAAFWLATAYARLVGDATRSHHALYFTPPSLAHRLIDKLLLHGASLEQHRWYDPACGGAAFLVPIAQRITTRLAELDVPAIEQLRFIERHVSGNELDPVLGELSREFLRMALAKLILCGDRDLHPNLFVGDGLKDVGEKRLTYDVLVCNPPYRKLTSREAMRYLREHGDVIEGQPNVYGLFINRAMQLAKKDGLIGLLTPTSFLSGRSFTRLRTKIVSLADRVYFGMLCSKTALFIDVEQETAITILRRRIGSARESAVTAVDRLTPEGDLEPVGCLRMPTTCGPWSIPRANVDVGLIRSAEANAFKLMDYGYAPRVGHLVAYRDVRVRHEAFRESSADHMVVPLIWATDITPDGRFKHGRDSKISRSERFVQVDSLHQKGIFTKPTVVLQRVTSSDQKRRLVAAAVPKAWVKRFGGYVCENHVIVLEPIRSDAISPSRLAAILNTHSVDRVFRAISSASNVAVYELNELSLPDPSCFRRMKTSKASLDDVVRTAYCAAD